MTSPQVPEQSESHAGLLDESRTAPSHARFDAILVPTYRPPRMLRSCYRPGPENAGSPLIVVCSRAVSQKEVIDLATRANVEAFAVRPATPEPAGDRLRDIPGRGAFRRQSRLEP